MEFQFFTPTQLVHGPGSREQIAALATPLGQTIFFVYSSSLRQSGIFQEMTALLETQNLQIVPYEKPPGEPDVDMTDKAAQTAKEAGCDLVLSIGGGAVIDLGKAVAGLTTNDGSVLDYMEGVGIGLQVTQRPLPHIAVPTTAGTGAEVTKNAVITAQSIQYKKSFRSPQLFPTIAVLDAELTLSLNAEQTAYSGMDAITQLIESFITKKASPITDSLALCGLRLALPAIRRLIDHGDDLNARENLLLASTLSGITLANAGLGVAHGFAPAFGALYNIPHGKACAILLPNAMRYNLTTVQEKFATIGRIVGSKATSETKQAEDAISFIQNTNDLLHIPRDFRKMRIPETHWISIIERSRGNSMKGNPIEITDSKALEFLRGIL